MIWTTILNYERNPTTASGLAISITMMNSNITRALSDYKQEKIILNIIWRLHQYQYSNKEYYLEVTLCFSMMF